MAMLAGKTYDPATAANRPTTAALAMTALDTTNLRLTFNAPANGSVLVHIRGGALHGAATAPQILLGVLSGATVVFRQAPLLVASNAAATSLWVPEVTGIVTGLAAGAAQTWDAAYAVETLVASTGYKYGGPNNTTANDAFGGVTFAVFTTT